MKYLKKANNQLKLILSLVIIISISLSCSKSEGPTEQETTEVIQTTGTLDLPTGLNTDGYTIISGLNEGQISGDSYDISLNENSVQLVSVFDQNDNPVLLSINIIEDEETSAEISPRTTAEALIYLNPFICTSNLTEATQIKQRINSLNSFNSLVNLIQNQLNAGTFSVTEQNTQLKEAIDDVYTELFTELGNSYLNKLNKVRTQIESDPNPNYEINGLRVTDFTESGDNLSFRISNRAKRWISVYIDKSVDGTTITNAGELTDIIPSPDISIWQLLTQGITLPTEYSNNVNVSTSGYEKIFVNCYGLGLLPRESDFEFSRAILPAAMTGVFDLGIPLVEVITGLHLTAELRGAPSQNPFYELVQEIATGIILDVAKKAQLFTWYREGDIIKIVADISCSVLNTCIENPSYIADILTQIVGRNVARSAVDSWLFPIRVVNAVITVTNLTYSLASVLSTEAITTFTFESTPVQYPIQVIGLVKDYYTQSSISDATITAYDENENIFSTTESDNSGNFSFYADPGIITIRVVAQGYKAVNQNLILYEDLANQDPAIYFAPTTWLSPFSSETGSVGGTVRNATNLNTISGVSVTLRYGVNDPNQEIVATTTSSSNGSYLFSDIPSGTYTAFFSKEGYIDDFLVITVIANQTSGFFDMNLSPDISTDGGLRIVLTWGLSPSDLDSHLFTPSINGITYHVYYSNKGSLTYPPYANLDVDDVTSYGPETITISQLYNGIYYYSVYRYSSSGELITSSAAVSVYGENGFIRSWNVPTSGYGRWWNVFSVNGATGEITNINQISSNPPASFAEKAERDINSNRK